MSPVESCVFFVFVLLHADLPVRAIDLGDVLESPKTEELSAGRMLQWLHIGFLVLYLCWGRYHPNRFLNHSKYRSQLPFDTERGLYHHYMSMGFHTTFNSAGSQFERGPRFWKTHLTRKRPKQPSLPKTKKRHTASSLILPGQILSFVSIHSDHQLSAKQVREGHANASDGRWLVKSLTWTTE